MNQKKSYFIAVLIIMSMVLYFFNSADLFQAKAEFTETDDLFFSTLDSNKKIQELSVANKENIELKLHNTSMEIHEVKIAIPTYLDFDSIQTQKLIEQEYPTLKEKENIVKVEANDLVLQFENEETTIETIPLAFSKKQVSNEKELMQELWANTDVKGVHYQSRRVKINFPAEYNEPIIQPLAGDLNVDLHLDSVYSSIESGSDGVFQLSFKVTGSQVSYHDATIEIDLPDNATFDPNLEQLKLADVTPTYDKQANKLSYFFEELNAGVSFTQLYKVQTENGFVTDGTELKASAEFKAPTYFEETRTEAAITVISALSLTANKAYVKTYDKNGVDQNTVPQPGNIGEWQIKVNIPQKKTGQLYIEENSKIIIKDELPKGISYVEDSLGGVYDAKTHTVTWILDAPSLSEQKEAEANLFTADFTIKTKFPDKLTKIESYTNKLSVLVTDISNREVTENSSASITAFPSESNVLPPVNGSLLFPVHFGPLNGKGIPSSEAANANPNPTVYGSATLGFSVRTSPMQADSPNKSFDSYDVTYKIDNNLDLMSLHFSEPLYCPNYTYYETNNTKILSDSATQMEIYGTINGKEQLLLTNPTSSQYYNLTDLGVSEHITQLRVHYTYRAAGVNQTISLGFGIQEGYSGKVKNSFGFDYTGYNKSGKKVSQKQVVNGTAVWQYSEDRTAQVVKAPANNNSPIVSNTINYETEENGTVVSGNNRVHGTFKNDPSSLSNATGPFDTYVLLSQGVRLDKENPNSQFSVYNPWIEDSDTEIKGTVSVKDENYLGQERQLLHIHWSFDRLAANETLTYRFNIIVGDDATSMLRPEAYSFLGNETFKVPASTGNSITDSVIQNDIHDLNGNGEKNEKLVKTGNQYYLANASGIITRELVKGELDDDFSMFGHTILAGDIHYRFELINKGSNKISNMTFMNVLPSVGDLGITDNQPLDSKFTPLMKGPIDLPDEWDEKVEVYYSVATNPKRDDLNDSVNYPSTTQPIPNPEGAQDPKWMLEKDVTNWEDIHSFMIKLKTGQVWQASEILTLDFDMKAPKTLNNELIDPTILEYERAAWNSFAFTVNGLQAVEPSKVGVVVNNAFNLQLIKEDEKDSSKKLSEAEFTLYDQDKTELETQHTDETGRIQFMSIFPGTYYIQETKAPPYYELNPTLYEIEVSNTGEITVKNADEFVKQTENADQDAQIKLVLSNRLKKLPNTGSKKLIVFFIGGLMLVVVGIGYLIKRNQEKGR